MTMPRFFVGHGSPQRPAERRCGVFIRAHSWDAKVQSLVAKLRRHADNYDLYIIYDTTHHPLPETLAAASGLGEDRILPISEQLCAEAGFYKGPGLVFYHCGDIALCYVMPLVPQYSFYAMIDWDLDFTAGNEDTLSRLFAALLADVAPPDFLGLLLHHCTWGDWHRYASKLFRDDHSYYAYGPFFLLSRPFLALVHAARQLHECGHPTGQDLICTEMFVPSLVAAAGLRMRDLSDYLPGAYKPTTIALNTGDYGVGLPLEGVRLIADGEAMVHPVYTAEHYARQIQRKFTSGPPHEWDLDGLRRYLERPELAALPPPLLASLREPLNAE